MTDTLKKLNLIIEDRKKKSTEESYVSSLYDKGLPHVCGKIDEEAKELITAIQTESNKRVVSEAADLWFHCLVALSMKNLSDDILEELEKRFANLDEEKNRNTLKE